MFTGSITTQARATGVRNMAAPGVSQRDDNGCLKLPTTWANGSGTVEAMEDISPMAVAIVACEIAFWVVLAAGLAARYLLRWQRTSVVLLVCTPLLDVVLLAFTVADLRGGGEATGVHGLGAAYLGFSVAFGHTMIRWADQRVAHRFAGGPPPVKPPRKGPARVRYEWREWGKCLAAVGIACAAMALLSFVVASPAQTEALWAPGGWMMRLGIVAAIWFAVGPVWTVMQNMNTRGLS